MRTLEELTCGTGDETCWPPIVDECHSLRKTNFKVAVADKARNEAHREKLGDIDTDFPTMIPKVPYTPTKKECQEHAATDRGKTSSDEC